MTDAAYARARDKRDKSIERYKFFVNGLYVAMTRAVRRLYLVESDTSHPLFRLLGAAGEAGAGAGDPRERPAPATGGAAST